MDRRVALVGFSFRLPQTSTDTFWQDLVAEKDFITTVESSRWSFDSYLHPDKSHPGTSYTFKAGSLGDIAGFDADFFGISPREATVMDPQQRHLLEMSSEAMEHAGIKPSKLQRSDCGVFIGISSTDYSYRMSDDLSVINSSTATGNTSSIASNRISYTFDLRGPSISMDTACSSSMVAFHQACQAILNGEVKTAITGGINLHLHPFGFIAFSKASMLSPDGRCKVFDESANGYVRSEGGGIFLLKDYDQAIADGDMIHAVVAASAVNTDGNKSGMTIPSCHAQSALMEQAYNKAGITADDVDYLEAHGTGTPVGDPIETRAIGKALGSKRRHKLPIGSVKSNLGHLESAAGVAGLVKALLVLKNRAIPATISMKNPNPDIKFDEWNIQVVDKFLPLKREGTITVGINSFGFGGANAHVILQSDEQYLSEQKRSETDSSITPISHALPIIVSAKSPQSLKQNAANLVDYLAGNESATLYDTAWGYSQNKERHQEAILVYAQDKPEAIAKLQQFIKSDEATDSTDYFTGKGIPEARGPVFIYSGNGCQWETMGKSLLASCEIFQQSISKVDLLFSKYADFSLQDEINGLNGSNRFEFTEIAQPALFAIQVGITEHLRSQEIEPSAVAGHSVGEVAAAWAAGALSLESAVEVIYYRSLYQGKTKGFGAMTAVRIGLEEVENLLQQKQYCDIHLAGINSYRGVTLAGNPDQMSQLEAYLEKQKIFNIRLPLDYAFHSPAMDPIKNNLLTALGELSPEETTIPFISTVTGTTVSGQELDATYWWNNIRQPVLFQQAIDHLLEEENNCFIEVGAHPVLRNYLQDQIQQKNIDTAVIPTMSRNNGSFIELEKSTAAAVIAGATNIRRWFPQAGKRLELPLYAWQKEHHWYPVTVESHNLLGRYSEHPLLGAPLPLQPLHWENQLDTSRMPWLADHQVGESVVYPGAGFIELVLNAAGHFRNGSSIEVEELEILAPLILEDTHSKVIQTRIDNESGEMTIVSRAHAISDQWTLNCKARAVHQTTGRALSVVAPTLPDRSPDFDTQYHQQQALRAGLQYGPAFSAVAYGWNCGDEILARLTLPEPIQDSASEYLLHPGVLDSAIQLILHFLTKELGQNSGTAFIPARVGRVIVQRTVLQQPSLVRLKLQRKAPHSLLTRFELFDDNGNAIAVMEDVRFKAIRLYRSNNHETAFLNYHLTPTPRTQLSIKELAADLDQAVNLAFSGAKEKILRYSNEVAPLLENLIIHAMAESLREIFDNLTTLDSAEVEALNLKNPENQNLRRALLAHAQPYGTISLSDGSYQLNQDSVDSKISSNLIWNTLLRDYPDYFTAIHLAGRTSSGITRKFLGQSEDVQPVNDCATYQRLFKDTMTQTCYPVIASALQQVITSQQQKLVSGQRLSVLEVSATQSHYGYSLCGELNFDYTDFAFASYSPEALESVTHLQERYPLATTIELDLEAPIDDAVANGRQFQLAVITLDQYSTQKNLKLLERIKPLLAEGASILISGLQPQFWLDFAFSGSADWWQNEDSAQASDQQWLSTLESQNFTDLSLLTSAKLDCGFYLIGATWSGNSTVPAQKAEGNSDHWLILTSGEQKEQNLIKTLSAADGNYTTSTSKESNALFKLLSKHASEGSAITQVILLDQIGNNSDPLSSQAARCTLVTELAQALETAHSQAQIWLVTEGVGATIPCDQNLTVQVITEVPADAAVWGFGRTFMNESLNNSVRLIDLPLGLNTKAVNELVAELQTPSDEPELIITAAGERFAPRLRIEDRPTALITEREDASHISLGFNLPGQLRNLQWQAKPIQSLRDDEVEIDVKATGLNFRDIMYALGLLSDEAIENGFAGATMGLEFSGQVTRIGKDVTQYAAGDAVVGFGSACFSNRIVSTTYSIAHMPEGVSYEGAATIPTTFLTVYYALHHLARLQPGEKVLIHGAAGGVGIAAIQIAQWLGAEIYATVGSQEKREFLELMGVTHIYNSRELTFAEEILRDTEDGRGVDVVLNSLAGEAINQNFRVLKPFGRFLELGKRDFYENTPIGLRPFRNNISYFGIDADQLQQEQPALTSKLFSEMMQLFADGTLFTLPYTEFNAHQIIDAFRYMQQAKQIGKIIVTYEEGLNADTISASSQPESAKLELDPEATYLVTGGLSGFGLKTAQWLVEKGAKHLLLISRRGTASEEAAEFLRSSAEQGVSALAKACDVTDKVSLERIIDLCGRDIPPLKGIVHAATVINDNLIRNLDQKQIETSLAAKLKGAQHLHELTRHLPLDMFVLYSSATTLLGNPGQAAYVAANHWLEALTATRKSQNLAATCARWGAIDDVGFLSRNEEIKRALQNRLGGNALNSEEALLVLEQMLLSNSPSLGIMELDWNSLSRFLPTASQNKFREIALSSAEAENCNEGKLDLETMMREMSESEFQAAILEILTRELSAILMIPETKIDPERSIYDMGMDSLMGVELMSAVEARTGIQIPVMALTETPKLSQLSGKIISLIGSRDDSNFSDTQTTEIQRMAAQHGEAADTDIADKIVNSIAIESSNPRVIH